ncbi:M20/M25/M40 family metallo-hydrolase [uncultured Sneathia sp.]|uniref:M20/M25/M40 family metallo-hydrolase n=1 Tax=uncultured Sneathia sp. TaxID=278067 RepID=UPI002595B88C|nr:M20/M25/M40 family metallo-hydrolase [uncultured Sneathia sp.]
MNLLETLSNLDAVASNEDEIKNFLKTELSQYADEILYDNLGSIIFKIGNNDNFKIMLDAHIDEVGFIVKNILDNGKILLKELGNVNDYAKFNIRGRITTTLGNKIYGIINGGSDDLHFDLGITNKNDIEKLGIEVGNMVCFATEFKDYKINNIVEGKALDNRVGCYILAQIIKKLKNKTLNSSIYFAFSSSEEVGLRGGKTAASLINPNIAFVIDVVSAKNVFDNSGLNTRKNGNGFLIEVYDKTFIPSKKMINLVKNIAIKKNIKYQLDTMNGGGTNAGEIHKLGKGIPSLVTAISLRYCHGSHSMVNMNDVNDLINVYVQLLQEI